MECFHLNFKMPISKCTGWTDFIMFVSYLFMNIQWPQYSIYRSTLQAAQDRSPFCISCIVNEIS